MKDPEEAELDFKMCQDINQMPDEVQPRFKAVKVLHDTVQELDEELDRDKRLLEIAFEQKYQQIYTRR